MTLAEHVERYVTFRRALGHAYVEQARCLQDYAAYGEARGDSFVRSSTVLDWASTTPSPRQAQVKLRYVCDLPSEGGRQRQAAGGEIGTTQSSSAPTR